MNGDPNIAREPAATEDTSPVCGGDALGDQAITSSEEVAVESDLDDFKRSLFAAFDRQTTKVQRAPRQFSSRARFTRRRRVGGGGLGDVYEAIDRKVGRVVAVKISKSVSSWTRCEDDRFFREYRLTARLQHPGIPAVYSAGRLANGRRFYSMRLVVGQTLTSLIRAQRSSGGELDQKSRRPELLTILTHFKDICNTVHSAHQAGYLHLDLKPDNIMIEPSGATFVVDWGLAQPFTAGTSEVLPDTSAPTLPELVRMPVVAGTPEFMAPEQFEGNSAEFDARTDVFALCGVLHAILTGNPPRVCPREVRGTRFWSVFRRSNSSDARGAVGVSIAKETPAELASICERGLAERPIDRYASALELREDIERWERGENVVAHQYKYRPSERMTRWVAQHARVVVPAALVGMIVILSLGLLGWQQASVTQHRAAAKQEKAAKDAATRVALGSLQNQIQVVQSEEFLRRPELLPLRLKLLQNAWKEYDHWAVNAVEDRELMIQVVHQLHQVADAFDETVSEQTLLQVNADPRVAETAIERATEVCRRLVVRPDGGIEARVLLATSYRLGAALASSRGRGDEALTKAGLGTKTLAAITGEIPGTDQELNTVLESVRTQRLLASIHYRRAMSAPTGELGREFLTRANDLAESALNDTDRLVATDQATMRERAVIESQVAIINHKLGRHSVAVAHYGQALSLLDQVRLPTPSDGRFDPNWVSINRQHAQILNNYGLTLRAMHESQSALDSHLRAKEIRKQIVERFPWLISVQSELAQSCGNIGDTLIDFGDSEAEIAARREATQLLLRMSEEYPSIPGIREFWGLHRVRIIAALHRVGADQQAAQEFTETVAICPNPEQAEPANTGHIVDVILGHSLAAQSADEKDMHRQAAIRLVLHCQQLKGFEHPINRRRLLTDAAFQWLHKVAVIRPIVAEASQRADGP